ncbi:hypothetical protein C8J56DRAFT_888703 [Mycena floridula]|nr:hypothetical protein C8J56DRAFT_888703 [Mycena floridula]
MAAPITVQDIPSTATGVLGLLIPEKSDLPDARTKGQMTTAGRGSIGIMEEAELLRALRGDVWWYLLVARGAMVRGGVGSGGVGLGDVRTEMLGDCGNLDISGLMSPEIFGSLQAASIHLRAKNIGQSRFPIDGFLGLLMMVQGSVLAQSLAGTNSTACDPGPCTAINAVSSCTTGGLTCICTQTYFDAYIACVDCAATVAGSDASAKATIDQAGKTSLTGLAKSCATAGFPGLAVPDFTAGTVGAGPTATAGKGQPAASGAPTSTKNDAADLKAPHFQIILITGYVLFFLAV